jgi:hypothetical protein
MFFWCKYKYSNFLGSPAIRISFFFPPCDIDPTVLVVCLGLVKKRIGIFSPVRPRPSAAASAPPHSPSNQSGSLRLLPHLPRPPPSLRCLAYNLPAVRRPPSRHCSAVSKPLFLFFFLQIGRGLLSLIPSSLIVAVIQSYSGLVTIYLSDLLFLQHFSTTTLCQVYHEMVHPGSQ